MFIRSDVVRRKIREHTDLELDARTSAEHKCLRRDFHNTAGTTCLNHIMQILLDNIGLRRRVDSMNMCVPDNRLNCSDKSRLLACMVKDGFHHICSCRLTLCTGNADDGNFFCRIIEPRSSCICKCNSGVVDSDYGKTFRIPFPDTITADEHTGCSHLCHFIDLLVRIEFRSDNTDECGTFRHFSGIIDNSGDFRRKISPDQTIFHFLKQFFKLHIIHSSFRPGSAPKTIKMFLSLMCITANLTLILYHLVRSVN